MVGRLLVLCLHLETPCTEPSSPSHHGPAQVFLVGQLSWGAPLQVGLRDSGSSPTGLPSPESLDFPSAGSWLWVAEATEDKAGVSQGPGPRVGYTAFAYILLARISHMALPNCKRKLGAQEEKETWRKIQLFLIWHFICEL